MSESDIEAIKAPKLSPPNATTTLATFGCAALLGAWITWLHLNEDQFPSTSGVIWLSSLFAFANLLTIWTVYGNWLMWPIRLVITGVGIAVLGKLIMDQEIPDDNLYWTHGLAVESCCIFLVLAVERLFRESHFSIRSLLGATVIVAITIALIRYFDFSLSKTYEKYTSPPGMSAFMIANSATSIAIISAIGLLAFSPIRLSVRIAFLVLATTAGPILVYVAYGWYGGPEPWRRATTVSPLLDALIVGAALLLIRYRSKIFGVAIRKTVTEEP